MQQGLDPSYRPYGSPGADGVHPHAGVRMRCQHTPANTAVEVCMLLETVRDAGVIAVLTAAAAVVGAANMLARR